MLCNILQQFYKLKKRILIIKNWQDILVDAEMDLVRALFLEEEMNDFEFLQKLFINWDTIKK